MSSSYAEALERQSGLSDDDLKARKKRWAELAAEREQFADFNGQT